MIADLDARIFRGTLPLFDPFEDRARDLPDVFAVRPLAVALARILERERRQLSEEDRMGCARYRAAVEAWRALDALCMIYEGFDGFEDPELDAVRYWTEAHSALASAAEIP